MPIAFPYHLDRFGCTATVTQEHYIEQMIEQVLFTMPNERVNRPTFGSGAMQMVFEPNSDEILAAHQFLVQGALQQWLGNLIQVEAVKVVNNEATLIVTVQYLIRQTQERKLKQFNYNN